MSKARIEELIINYSEKPINEWNQKIVIDVENLWKLINWIHHTYGEIFIDLELEWIEKMKTKT